MIRYLKGLDFCLLLNLVNIKKGNNPLQLGSLQPKKLPPSAILEPLSTYTTAAIIAMNIKANTASGMLLPKRWEIKRQLRN